jgi:hypothetical protein
MPYDDMSSDSYQRKHARSACVPTLSQPVAVGVPQSSQYEGETANQNYNSNQEVSHTQNYMNDSPNFGISPSKFNEFGDQTKYVQGANDTLKVPVYNNQLFEGGMIPSRQHSYSENSAFHMNRDMMVAHPVQIPHTGRGVYNSKMAQTQVHESQAVDSTTLSSEVFDKKAPGLIESDALNFLFVENIGYERRADSLKSPIPPGLTCNKYRMEEYENKSQPNSATDFADQVRERLEHRFNLPLQRKITEDNEHEGGSQYDSDHETDVHSSKNNGSSSSSKKKSKMCKSSVKFLPKHLREEKVEKQKEDFEFGMTFDINQLIDSTVNSRKQSIASEDEGEAQNNSCDANEAQESCAEQNVEDLTKKSS